MKFYDKVALVTGGGRGIGLEIARCLALEGASVIICDRSADILDAAVAALGDGVVGVMADIGQSEGIVALASHFTTGGKLDILINNAGIQENYSFFHQQSAMADSLIENEIAINLTGPLLLIFRLLPVMRKSSDAVVLNISSALAYAPKASAVVYCATKAALSSATRSLRYQAEDDNAPVRFAEAILPLVDTDMTKGRGSGKADPAAVARQLVNGIKSGHRQIWVGKASIFRVIFRLWPGLAYRMVR